MKRVTNWITGAICLMALNLLTVGGSATTVMFRQGEDNGFGVYNDASDTWIVSARVNENNSSHVRLDIDLSPNFNQSVIRFDDILGPNPGQIPYGVTVDSAIFTLYAYDSGDTRLPERMLGDWDATTLTWSNAMLGGNTQGGIQRDGVEATADAASFSGGGSGYRNMDVTAIVQAWSDGAPNYGMALLEWSSDGLQSASSDAATIGQRPLLTVTYTIPEPSGLLLMLVGLSALMARRPRPRV